MVMVAHVKTRPFNTAKAGPLTGKRYLMSLTFNAPEGSFNNPNQAFFGGRGLDDLFLPMHLNFQFFGMEAMETFACYDVMKNPSIEKDFEIHRPSREALSKGFCAK